MNPSILQQLTQQPIDLKGDYFIHLNNADICYLVSTGTAHLFCWIFDNQQPTSNKLYVGSFTAGQLILGGSDYIENKTTCGFYLILDHDASIKQLSTQELLATDDTDIATNINNYLNCIAGLQEKYQPASVQQKTTVIEAAKAQAVAEESYFVASDQDVIMWVTSQHVSEQGNIIHANDGNLALINNRLPIEISAGHTYNSFNTLELLQQQRLGGALITFDHAIKRIGNTLLNTKDKLREDNFFYLQNIQKSHIDNTFNHLFDSYYGALNITPESVVIDEGLGINRLITQLCRLFNMPIKANAVRIIEALDFNNWGDVEHALEIYQIRGRNIELEKDWLSKETWIMLSRLVDTQQTILITYNNKHYQYFDVIHNNWVKIDASNVQNIDNNAYMLYRSLPDTPIQSGFDLFKSSFWFFRKDIKSVVFTGILIGITNLVTPIIIGRLLSEALPSNNINLIYSFLLAMLCAAVGVALFQFVNNISIVRIESKSSMDIHASIWSRLLRLPISFFDKHSIGDLSDRANMIESIYSIWSSAVTNAILSLFSVVAVLCLLFYYSPSLALLSFGLIAFVIIAIVWFYVAIKPAIRDLYHYKGTLDNVVFQMLTSIHKLRIASKENTMLSLWANVYNKIVVNNRKYTVYNAIMQSFFQALPLISSIVVFAFTYYFLFKDNTGDFNLGDFISFNTAFGQLTSAFVSLSAVLSSIIITKPMIERIMPILQAEVETGNHKMMINQLHGEIELNNVFFRYKPEMPLILNNLSLHIKPGEYVAIVGASGSGKSTILRLLMGFEEAQSGSILIDGNNIQEIELSSLRKNIGIVLQNGKIMPGSIKDNITAGNPNISENDVWESLQLAGIKKEVQDMPMGLHTIISENGSNISGGQLQRIIIARALVTKPNLMFLDEATSAMDNVVQRLVQETLENMSITRIVIAHRLSTIINADTIYVMDQGKIVEKGNYQELMQQGQHFYQLVSRQQ